jgi:outer membrane protein assembly factor BamB
VDRADGGDNGLLIPGEKIKNSLSTHLCLIGRIRSGALSAHPPPMYLSLCPRVLSVGVACLCSPALIWGADWPQWRGPARNGSVSESPLLAESWGTDGPSKVWESEAIPSDDDGGHGSVVVADGKAYLSVVWHRDEPSETRTITDLILRVRLDYQNPSSLGKELIEKIEATREGLSPSLRGAKLDAFIESFVAENLDKKKRELFGGYVAKRFKKGKLAIPLGDYERLRAQSEKPFASQADFETWVNEQKFSDHVRQAVLDAVPASRRVAEDTVICLDARTGKTLWITRAPGEPKGRNCSSTPCVSGGRVYAVGSANIYAVDAKSGELIWSQSLGAKAPGSSPVVVGDAVVVLAGKLNAFDTASGKVLWEQAKVTGNNASPVLWKNDGKDWIVCNSRSELVVVDPHSGAVISSTPGGGDSTPAIEGNHLVNLSSNESLGFSGYRLSSNGFEKLWSHPTDARRSQSSPIIFGNHAYLFEDGEHRCVHVDSGVVAWSQKIPSSITSPLLADGKVLVVINNGNNLLMAKASPEAYTELGKANIRALWVPSPSLADGLLYIRHRDAVRCYDLRKSPLERLKTQMP